MAHECVSCGATFPNGSDQVLEGCQSCGGNKFQFVTETTGDGEGPPTPVAEESDEGPQEDSSQHAARTDVVDVDELPSFASEPSTAGKQSEQSDGSSPPDDSLEEIRQALNEQFESIRIVSPGEYELNLMELYEKDDHVISLHSDGKYAIHVGDQGF